MKKVSGVKEKPIAWETRRVKVSELKPYEKNPRKISPADFEHLKKSLTQDGYHQRIIATPDLRVIGGHQRIKALTDLGLDEIEILVPDRELDADQFKRILVRDNLAYGAWELEQLGELMPLGALLEIGVPDDIVSRIDRAISPGLTDDDAAEEIGCIAVTQLGDTWIMGDHRLHCGDATRGYMDYGRS